MSCAAITELEWLRDQVLILCETMEDNSHCRIERSETDHEKGFHRGAASQAKSIRRTIAEVVRCRTVGIKSECRVVTRGAETWRPIAEARHDGTVYLLGFYDSPEKTEESWCAVEGWYESGPVDKCWYSIFHEEITPTHFRERFAPPR